jgi:hypothetical protein
MSSANHVSVLMCEGGVNKRSLSTPIHMESYAPVGEHPLINHLANG